ncbi:GLPGLI family protein [Xanthocytophaga agilis]|uniref:GLPGLI family protein n=1 Tax=Xanthocytophaga agilis TaxID=3048010 RepID=A0AAE3RBB4_9BACT|nr:GLPGLI family protein [Xanthocytophaga agilis]MDJ1504277.1 GLPGLI family protein [Xanthocytophaga agilis]
MKKLFLLITLGITLTSFGQNQEGVITYAVTVKIMLPPGQAPANMPPPPVFKNQLLFTGQESLYKTLEEDNEEEEENNGGMRIKINRPLVEIYTNQKSHQKITQREFLGKQYLISDTLKNIPWQLSDQTKQIQGITCKKATYYNAERKRNLTAWYAENIYLSSGPDGYSGLPGLILELDSNNGEMLATATKIELRKLTKDELVKAPVKGKPITENEFRKMQDDRMREMEQQGGNVRIFRN